MDIDLDTRPSPIAGRWYPGDAGQLAREVDEYMGSAELPEIRGEIMGVVAPHAGHRYSGPVAGYAFAALRGIQPDLVAVVSPMHHPYVQPLLTSDHMAYQTPLGRILIDQEAVAAVNSELEQVLGFELSPIRYDQEHSLEIELPFLQRALENEFRLLPIMVRDQSPRVGQALGEALAKVLRDRNALLVASSDLSHFYSQTRANELDGEMLRQMEAFDPQGVLRAEEQGKGFACGRIAIAAVFWAARELGANKVQVLNYGTSGDVTGDYQEVVGYAAAVITRV